MTYSIDPITADCYKGTTCLINKLNIRDENALAKLETMITLAKTAELELTGLKDGFTDEDYKDIHRFIFGDLYDWAGEYRTVDMSKKGTAFANYHNIPDLMGRCFGRLKRMRYLLGLGFGEFIDEIVDLYCNINHIHPFREGNGRVQRSFITQLVRYNGYDINFSEIDTDELMIATINAAQGVTVYLRDIFYSHITTPD